ncbi:GDSL-type esterase/lipase family protein [Neobacillus sp. D3-1R]|uniref:GDSL-type esterase/lipase family protein n=1 Tax=Neobacillus sp. D3-1R TaxID=3445778 RepID=UPI003FA0CC30
MVKKYSVKITIILSSLSLLLFSVGLIWTIQTHFFNHQESNIEQLNPVNEVSKKTQNRTIIALGDSLTRGTGDEGGKGYIGYLVEQLQEKTKQKITLQNLGVKGFRSKQLLNQVGQEGIKRQVQEADIIIITIGGNDLFQGGQTLLKLNQQNVDKLREQYLVNLKEMIFVLRTANKDATIFFVGLYNPFIDLSQAEVTTKAVRQWNFETSELLDQFPQTVFVPTFDLFQLKVNDYLYSDKFHPNAEGYKLIAERVASLITW